jgi:hypothetical protein
MLSGSTNPFRDSQFRSRHFSPPLQNVYRPDTAYPVRTQSVLTDRMQAIPMDALYPDRMLAIRGVLAGLYS